MSSKRSLSRCFRYLTILAGLALSILVACRPSEPTLLPPPTPLVDSTKSGAAPLPAAVESPLPLVESHPTAIAGAVAEAPTTSIPSIEVAKPSASDRYADLRQAIASQLAGLNGDWGIAVQDLRNGDALLMGPNRPYPAASLYKLLLLYDAYQSIDNGNLRLDQMTTMLESDYVESILWDEELKPGDRVSVKGLLRVMVIQSSNAAAHALNRVMGSVSIVDRVNAAAARLNLADTRMPVPEDRGRYGDWRAEKASTSITDLAGFFGKLYRGELVSKEASEAMLALLKEQQINDRIPARLPKGVKVAHKTGNLPGVVADAGIIFGPRASVTLIVLNDGADYEPATAAIGKIGELVYNWHNRP